VPTLYRGLGAAKLCVAAAAHATRHFQLVRVTAEEGFLRMFNNEDLGLSRIRMLDSFLNQLVSVFQYLVPDNTVRALCPDFLL
jgi:hypothetical protein